MKLRSTLCALALIACSKKEPPAAPAAANVEPAPTPVAQTSAAPVVEPTPHNGLAWYEDSMEAARAEAARGRKLLFIDLWAAWCHTCLSMRAHVLTRETFPDASQLVFVALDTEKAANAPELAKLPIGAWPTFYLVDATGQVFGRWVGAASAKQLEAFVRDGLRAFDASTLPVGDPLGFLIEGDRQAARDQLAAARDAYQKALAKSPSDWPRRADTWASLLGVLRKLGDNAACADAGLRGLDETGGSSSATDFSYWALDCLRSLPKTDPRVRVLQKRIAARLLALCEQGDPALSPDDRGDACGLLHTVYEELNDKAGARRAYELRLGVLNSAAAGKPDEIAKTYDAARVETLLGLGRAEKALNLLQDRAQALPHDYNPPHQLARLYRDRGQWDEGLVAIDRALKLAQQDAPRHAAMLGVLSDLLSGAGRREEARATLELQLMAYRALPEGQQQPQREQAVAKKLAALP